MKLGDEFKELKKYNQFILYKLVWTEGNPKPEKLPVAPTTLQVCNAHDPGAWVTYDVAESMLNIAPEGYGIAFVFTEQDPFFFLDIDHCNINGAWSPLANELMAALPGALIEVSVSGNGLHIFGKTAPLKHKTKNQELGIELYTSKRFVALTNSGTVGDAGVDCTVSVTQIAEKYFKASTEQIASLGWSDQPVPEWNGYTDDNELLVKALKSGSAASTFGNKARFADLWENNTPVLATTYKSINPLDPYDRSSADIALAHHLAFWTGKNHARIWDLMWKSKLVRDKWHPDNHRTYLQETINNAVNNQKDVHSRKKISSTPDKSPAEAAAGGGQSWYVSNADQVAYFKGCTYVNSVHKIFLPNGYMVKPDQFKARYSGKTFVMDDRNERTTRNAWEAFIDNQVNPAPKVDLPCFRPELPSGKIIIEENTSLLNTYTPIITVRKTGPVDPFLTHFRKILVDEDQRAILMAYMAACVQHRGVKFQWCPVLQGAEGNGKSLLSSVVAFAIGYRYTHFPNASDLAQNGFKFNAWIYGKLLIIIEEIYTSNKREITEPLKVMVTNEKIEIQAKGQDQFTGDNRANFLINTNHKDGLMVTIDGRRYCIMYSAQQSKADIVAAGMGGDYFPKLYNWLKKENGFEYVNEYLHTYDIPAELNPAGVCQRAPNTSSLSEAVELSMGAVEAQILEAVDEGRPGFRDPWVSSIGLENLLKEMGADRRIPVNKRRSLMAELGYIRHPHLTAGRLNKIVGPEGGKPRLYIKKNHFHVNLDIPNAIFDSYCQAQNYAQVDIVSAITG